MSERQANDYITGISGSGMCGRGYATTEFGGALTAGGMISRCDFRSESRECR
jgi:hypothetical protein